MDQLLTGLYEVFSKLVPFFLCLLFLAVILLCRAIIVFLRDLKFTMDRVNRTLDDALITVNEANRLLENLHEPLDTVVNIARTVDRVDAFTNRMFQEAFSLIATNISIFVDWLKKLFSKNGAADLKEAAENEEEENKEVEADE